MMPPMPRVSAMVWRRPNFFGTSKSVIGAGLVAADLEGDDDEVGAVEGGALVAEGPDRGGDAEGLGELADDDLGLRRAAAG